MPARILRARRRRIRVGFVKPDFQTRPARARGYDDLDPGRFFAEACQAVADAGEADERDRDLERWEVDMWLDVFKDVPLE